MNFFEEESGNATPHSDALTFADTKVNPLFRLEGSLVEQNLNDGESLYI